MRQSIQRVHIRSLQFAVECARTPFQHARGLMGRSHLPIGHGMLFLFHKDRRYTVWMMGMRFPIDVIWIDQDMRIVDIARDLSQRPIPFLSMKKPSAKARYILEIAAGQTTANNICIGDRVRFE